MEYLEGRRYRGQHAGEHGVHEQYWEQLAKLNRADTARRAGCAYRAERDFLAISLLNREYLVDPVRRTIETGADTSEARSAGYLEQLCILAYLVGARDLPPAGKLVSADRLDPGGFFFRGSHRLPVERLAAVFGPAPPLLHKAGHLFNATPQTFGDASIELSVLPRISLTIVIWAADEEFPARASILFDRSASEQLPLDVLFAAATLALGAVVSAADKML